MESLLAQVGLQLALRRKQMSENIKAIFNVAKGEMTYEEMTPEEIETREQMRLEQEAQLLADEQARAEAEATKASAISKLTALGLTESEALALVGA